MKLPCRTCGVHFPQDFDKTNEPACNLWGDIGFTNVSREIREKLWIWIFSMPTDEIYLETSLALGFNVYAGYVPKEDSFDSRFPEYKNMTEEQQQEFQRDFFKNKRQPNEIDNLSTTKNIVKVGETKN